MSLENKIEAANRLIVHRMELSNPVLACSFGKDSMVMLDLVLRLGYKPPVVYWRRERHFPLKQQFANAMIEKFDLVTYDFPPRTTRLIRKGSKIEVVNYFTVGNDMTTAVPSGIVQPAENEEFLCALVDMYEKPTGLCEFPWNAMFAGHKDTDVDPLQGHTPLTQDEVEVPNGPTLCFPIRHFTDDDIWEYTKKFDVPQDMNRYKPEGEDVAYNNDYYPACTACMNPENPSRVMCPKLGHEVDNVSSMLNWVESIRPAYWAKET